MTETVKLGYAAASNITFKGEYDTMMTPEEWEDLAEEAQDYIMTEALYKLVDIWVK